MDSVAEQKIGSRLTWLTIFTSASTLLCCALPAMLVALGAGAALASLVGVFPQIVWVSENKTAVFLVAGVMLAVAGYLQHRARFLPCPVDSALAAACARQRRVSYAIYFASLAIYVVGVGFAVLAPYLMD
jgi:drug/metabolite transporter superfamily protein YnfA